MMHPVKILLIEDDEIVARTIVRSLLAQSMEVVWKPNGPSGLETARRGSFDLVLLDVIMPEVDGYTVAQQMRADPFLANLPILFLTARSRVEDRLAGFRAGGDDYMPKPFNIDELTLRIKAILRRTRRSVPGRETASGIDVGRAARESASHSEHSLNVGEYSLDTRSFELTTRGRGRVRLTPVQFDLLYHLMSHAGQPFTPARLLDEVWDYPNDHGSPDLVRVHIKTLRSRVEEDPLQPTFICTVPGRGYMVRAESEQGR